MLQLYYFSEIHSHCRLTLPGKTLTGRFLYHFWHHQTLICHVQGTDMRIDKHYLLTLSVLRVGLLNSLFFCQIICFKLFLTTDFCRSQFNISWIDHCKLTSQSELLHFWAFCLVGTTFALHFDRVAVVSNSLVAVGISTCHCVALSAYVYSDLAPVFPSFFFYTWRVDHVVGVLLRTFDGGHPGMSHLVAYSTLVGHCHFSLLVTSILVTIIMKFDIFIWKIYYRKYIKKKRKNSGGC